jgi:hypothetical protein
MPAAAPSRNTARRRLVLDLLARRPAGGPVPVLAPVASWNPAVQGLRDWLGAKLITDYSALGGPPLDADAVRGYLCDDVADPATRARWDPVRALLGTKAPAGQALGSPLMVGLARAIYNPRPGELAGTVRDPAGLCSPALADRAAVESLLFDAFIPAAYRPPTGGRWTAEQAEEWLVFLARHLEQTIGNPDLAWWQLRRTALPTRGSRSNRRKNNEYRCPAGMRPGPPISLPVRPVLRRRPRDACAAPGTGWSG